MSRLPSLSFPWLAATFLALCGAVLVEARQVEVQVQNGNLQLLGGARVNINGGVIIVNSSGPVPNPGGGAAPSTVQGPGTGGTLHWRNGETLRGELVGVKDGLLSWWSPLFAEPLSLDPGVLRAAVFAGAPMAPDDPFIVNLRDGGRLSGTPVELDADTLRLRGAHGEITLRLDEVVSLQRTRGPGLFYRGPDLAERWDTKPPSGQTAGGWKVMDDGAFGTRSWNRGARLPMDDLPKKAEVLLRLRAGTALDFSLMLVGATALETIALQTWDDTLVLTTPQGLRFAPVMKLKDTTRLTLRLCWDREGGGAQVFDPEGRLLAELPPRPVTPPTDKPKPENAALPAGQRGLTLHNNGHDLYLDELRVRTWSGKPPAPMSPGTAHIELREGDIVKGRATRLKDGRLTLAGGRVVPLDQLEELVTGIPPADPAAASPPTSVLLADGTRLHGAIESAGGGRLALQTSASREPIVLDTARLTRLSFALPGPVGPPVPLAKLDRFTVSGLTLHGRMAGAGGPEPQWWLVGASAPATVLSAAKPSSFRSLDPATLPEAEALVYLENGDVLPAVLRVMDTHTLRVESGLAEAAELPVSQLLAVQFGGRRPKLTGFDDPGWRQIRGEAKDINAGSGSISFSGAAAFAHPNILQGDEVKFSVVSAQGWGSLRFRVLTSSGDNPQGGIPFLIYHSGSEVYAGQESTRGGDFVNQVQLRIKPNTPAAVRVALQEQQVELFVNNVSVCKVPLKETEAARRNRIANGENGPPPGAHGLGLVLETASLWGNGEQPVSVRDFTVRPNPLRPWMPAVEPAAKEQTLTLPRFRSDDPPTHVLVALNGDVLRGRLEAVTSEHLRVMSGLEPLTVPRGRVAAIIRLQPPDKPDAAPAPAPPAPGPTPTHWLLLTDGGRLAVNVERFGEDRITGRSPLLGRIDIPWNRIHTVRGTAPEPTAAQTAYLGWKLKPW